MSTDFEFTEEQCCLNCQMALSSLEKWYYMDDFGSQQGPFDSFMILYYIHFGYFEDDSVFFMYDKANGIPSNYNTLSNYVSSIVEDVTSQAPAIFACPHFMEQFPVNEDYAGPSSSLLYAAPEPRDSGSLRGTRSFAEPPESEGGDAGTVSRNKSPSEQSEDLRHLATKTILKKRVETNLREADAHLMRVNSRRVSHVLEKGSLGRER